MGWALANIWYDKYPRIPEPNSPLESLFMLVALRRMEAEVLSTRAIVHASMTSDTQVDPTVKAYKEYADKVLPFLAGAQDLELQKEKETLLRFTKSKLQLRNKNLYQKQGAQLRGSVQSRFQTKARA